MKARGRVCLLGDHNDWAGNCSLAAAIEQGIDFSYTPRPDMKVVMRARNLVHNTDVKEEFALGEEKFEGSMKYVEAVAKVLIEKGLKIGGLDLSLISDLPIKKGLSSSAALSVGATRAFNEAFSLGLCTEDIINIAYAAEHDILGIGCGKMDQTASAYEGVVYIEFSPFSVEKVRLKEPLYLVIGETGGDRDTKKILNTLNYHYNRKDPEMLKVFQRITDITKAGKEALSKEDLKLFGRLMDENQDCYEVLKKFCGELDSKRLYECLNVARGAGALGAKWTGAGGNGSFIALSEDEKRQTRLLEALKEAGTAPIRTVINSNV